MAETGWQLQGLLLTEADEEEEPARAKGDFHPTSICCNSRLTVGEIHHSPDATHLRSARARIRRVRITFIASPPIAMPNGTPSRGHDAIEFERNQKLDLSVSARQAIAIAICPNRLAYTIHPRRATVTHLL